MTFGKYVAKWLRTFCSTPPRGVACAEVTPKSALAVGAGMVPARPLAGFLPWSASVVLFRKGVSMQGTPGASPQEPSSGSSGVKKVLMVGVLSVAQGATLSSTAAAVQLPPPVNSQFADEYQNTAPGLPPAVVSMRTHGRS